jgi:cob(I)alamin adenosyltransferase
MFELKLTTEQETAIVKEYGSLDYLQAYCEMLADHLAEKQAQDAILERNRLLNKIADDPVVVAKMEEVKAAEVAEAEAEKPIIPLKV